MNQGLQTHPDDLLGLHIGHIGGLAPHHVQDTVAVAVKSW